MNMEKREILSIADLTRTLGLKRVTVQDWIDRGFIKPTIRAKGQGTLHIFDFRAVFEIIVFKELLSIGIKRKKATAFLAEMSRMSLLYFDPHTIGFLFSESISGEIFAVPIPHNRLEEDFSPSTYFSVYISLKKVRKDLLSAFYY